MDWVDWLFWLVGPGVIRKNKTITDNKTRYASMNSSININILGPLSLKGINWNDLSLLIESKLLTTHNYSIDSRTLDPTS